MAKPFSRETKADAADRQREERRRKKESGICRDCREPAVESRSQCPKHLTYGRDARRRARGTIDPDAPRPKRGRPPKYGPAVEPESIPTIDNSLASDAIDRVEEEPEVGP